MHHMLVGESTRFMDTDRHTLDRQNVTASWQNDVDLVSVEAGYAPPGQCCQSA